MYIRWARKARLFVRSAENNQNSIRGDGRFGMGRKRGKGGGGFLFLCFSCSIVVSAHILKFSFFFTVFVKRRQQMVGVTEESAVGGVSGGGVGFHNQLYLWQFRSVLVVTFILFLFTFLKER